MNRIDNTFAKLKERGKKALVGFLTAGDPTIEESERDVRTALDNGIDILELGVPFSDPTADGPTIQAASLRALSSGTHFEEVLGLVRRIRKDYDTPIILFGYANPLFKYGYEDASAAAADAGADGMLIVDLPFEECGEIRVHMTDHGLCFIPLIAPTTSGERASSILETSSGFVYYIMVTGVTGAREAMAGDVGSHVTMLREKTKLPIVVGFGVSSGAQAGQAGKVADGVVVGSALIRAARENNLAEFVRELRTGLDS